MALAALLAVALGLLLGTLASNAQTLSPWFALALVPFYAPIFLEERAGWEWVGWIPTALLAQMLRASFAARVGWPALVGAAEGGRLDGAVPGSGRRARAKDDAYVGHLVDPVSTDHQGAPSPLARVALERAPAGAQGTDRRVAQRAAQDAGMLAGHRQGVRGSRRERQDHRGGIG